MSIRAAVIRFVMKRTVKKQFDSLTDVVEFRRSMANASKLSVSIPKDVLIAGVQAEDINCEWVQVDGVDESRVVLYLHGGGYVFGGPESHRDLAWRLSAASGMRVLVVDYKLAPETPFPAAVEDATGCYRWLLGQGIAAENICIGGDSAGGGLSVATLVNLKNLGLPQPGACILMSPWVDLSVSGESVTTNAKSDAMLTRRALETMAKLYLGERDRRAPLASPVFADLSQLAPILVHVGSTEILLSDAEQLVERVKNSGGAIELEVWPKMPHVFQLFAGRIPEGKLAIEKLGHFVKQQLQQSETGTRSEKVTETNL